MTITIDRAENYLATAIAVEQSTGPDRHLDAHIYDALGYQTVRTPSHPTGIAWRRRGHGPLDAYGGRYWITMSRLTHDLGEAYDHLARPLVNGSNISLELHPSRATASMILPLGPGMIQSRANKPALAVCGLIMRLMHWRAENPLDGQAMALARHALGFDNIDIKKSYRNRYAASPTSGSGIHFEDMVQKGFARRDIVQPGSNTIYAMTFEGAIRALQPGEALCGEDFPR